jgi:hypothetical protein
LTRLSARRVSLGCLTLLLAAWPRSLSSQTPVANKLPVAGELPRFTLRQMVVGRNDSDGRLPGSWIGAATAVLPESLAVMAYADVAHRSGITPLQGTSLSANRSHHVMGLYARSELLLASHQTLEAIRAGIPSEITKSHFDRIFRPRGQWIVDVHDAALAWARSRMPGISWDSVRRVLAATDWVPRDDRASSAEELPRALYGLTVLAATDSNAFAAAQDALWRADSASALAVQMLLRGYTESRHWYAEALGFFMSQPWVPEGRGRSIADHVRDAWRKSHPRGNADLELPEVQTRWFGYPQAVPHYGIPRTLFRRLVKVENPSASKWLERHGEAGLLRSLRRLPAGDTSLTLLHTGSETLRLTTVPRQSRESLNGFLEPRDAIAIDPGYAPLLALGAVVHEWQHLVFRRLQLQALTAPPAGVVSPIVELPGIQPYLAEGFAEWSTERILAPVVARWPLLGLGELEKRAGLARNGPDDQHSMGYALVRALAAVLPDPAAIPKLLLKYADRPADIVREPSLRRAWSKYHGIPDRDPATTGHRLLIPEVTFTIEDGFPDVIATRILVPGSNAGPR